MKQFLLVFAVSIFSCVGTMFADDAGNDLKKLAGSWLPTEAELAGKAFPEKILKSMKLTLSDGKYTVAVGEQLDQGNVKIDHTAKPKSMDIVGTEGPNKGKTLLAIYELDGDKLRICYDLAGKKRPTEFKTEPETRQFLVTYQREKK